LLSAIGALGFAISVFQEIRKVEMVHSERGGFCVVRVELVDVVGEVGLVGGLKV